MSEHDEPTCDTWSEKLAEAVGANLIGRGHVATAEALRRWADSLDADEGPPPTTVDIRPLRGYRSPEELAWDALGILRDLRRIRQPPLLGFGSLCTAVETLALAVRRLAEERDAEGHA